MAKFANRETSYDDELTLVILGTVTDHHTHTRPNQSKIKKWKGIVSDGFVRMTAYFIAEDVNEDLTKFLPHGQIISSNHFSPLREEVHGKVTYCEIRFIQCQKHGTIPPTSLPVDIASIPIFTSGSTLSKSSSSSSPPTIDDCCGVACTAALAGAHDQGEDDSDVPINVLDTCVATLDHPSLSAMASFNSFYDAVGYPNPDNLPTHHKRQCMYFYYAVHHFEGRGVRVDLPCCVRIKIHDTFPCENAACERVDCPSHCSTFQDAFGYPGNF